MPVTKLSIANGFYQSDSLPLSAQECLNYYPNLPQSAALNEETLFGTPGLNQLTTTGVTQHICRGGHVMASIPYFVNGTDLHRINQTIDSEGVETFSITDLGDIENTIRVSMADNGTQLMILVPGGKGYIYTADPDTLTEITDLDFTANGQPQYVVYVDGYFVVTTDTKKFIASDLNNGLSWNALFVGSAESDPDTIVAPFVFKNQLFIWGSETGEGFDNIAGADFPFERNGLFLSKGVFAPFSLVASNDTFMFVGGAVNESPAIWAFEGNTTRKVSTTAIDSILQDLTAEEVGDIFAWTYAQKGAYFVGFTLPETTLVFDVISQRWHERKSFIDKKLARFRVNALVTAYGRVMVGDSIDGRIGEMTPDIFNEYGEIIFRRVATQPFQNNMQSFLLPWIELTIESGVGDLETPDPKMRMERSLDGKLFLDARERSMGDRGEHNKRLIWRRNGRASRMEVFRFTCSEKVKPVILQLTAEII